MGLLSRRWSLQRSLSPLPLLAKKELAPSSFPPRSQRQRSLQPRRLRSLQPRRLRPRSQLPRKLPSPRLPRSLQLRSQRPRKQLSPRLPRRPPPRRSNRLITPEAVVLSRFGIHTCSFILSFIYHHRCMSTKRPLVQIFPDQYMEPIYE